MSVTFIIFTCCWTMGRVVNHAEGRGNDPF